jgi:glycosyltransferase involved in cell wall biosynthesis
MVTTAKGIEGIDLERGTHCLVTGDISEQFVDSVIQLASNDEDRVAMQRAQREFAREHSWARSINRLDKFYTNQV